MLEIIKKKRKYLPIYLSIILLIYQILNIVFINLTQLKYHMGLDCSTYYLYSIEAWKQKTLILSNWNNQTTLFLDSPAPMAALFYGLFGNIFLAYGFANILCISILIYILILIFKQLKFSLISILLCLNITLSPFITMQFNNANSIGYAEMIYFGMGAYSIKIFIIFLLIKISNDLDSEKIDKKQIMLCIIASFLIFISAVSSGYLVLMTAIFPLIVYQFINMFLKNDIKVVFNKNLYYLIINFLLVIIGNMITTKLLNFSSAEKKIVLTPLSKFWLNFGSIFLGYFELLGSMTLSDILIFSNIGIHLIINLSIALLNLFGFLYYLKFKINKKSEFNNMILKILVFFIINICIFVFALTTYGSPNFEIRYLIPIFFVLVIFTGYFLDDLNDTILLKKAFILVSISLLTISNTISNTVYIETRIDYKNMQEIVKSISKINSQVVYCYGQDIFTESRNLRVIDPNTTYKFLDENIAPVHWGDYLYYDDNAYYQGPTALVTTDVSYEKLPLYIRTMYKKIDTIGIYNIYLSDFNKIDFTNGLNLHIDSEDFPYTNGIYTSGGIINEFGEYVSEKDTSGTVMWGPYSHTVKGIYDFTLNYEIIESEELIPGTFDIALNYGKDILKSISLDKELQSITIENIEFNNSDDLLEYRVFLNKGTSIKIKSIKFTNKTKLK